MKPRIGSLFSGYRGLDMAVEAVTGGETVWCSDIDPGANKILAHHWPNVPNLGDITEIDWSQVEPVDILTGGFPCQDVSAAGRRTGLIRYGAGRTRSGLWAEMARAIGQLRPRLVIAENVRGLLSAKADPDPDLFGCLGCMAHAADNPMRALGAVLGDLATLGFDAEWRGVRASDVGAPHQRFRVFVIAWPRETPPHADWLGRHRCAECDGHQETGVMPVEGGMDADGRTVPAATPDTDRPGLAQWGQQPTRHERAATERSDPHPALTDGTGGPGSTGRDGGDNLRTAVTLLPSTVCHLGDQDAQDVRTETRPGQAMSDLREVDHAQAVRREVGGPDTVPVPGALFSSVREQPPHSREERSPLACTQAEGADLRLMRDGIGPACAPYRPEPCQQCGRQPGNPVLVLSPKTALAGGPGGAHGCDTSWGAYEAAIRRWENVIGRCGPAPTVAGPRGGQRLSPLLTEWMMGLPAGHVTDPAIGLTRNEQLKALGNGVVPQQAEAAIRTILTTINTEQEARAA